ncbi:DUF2937 family protein [Catenovulum sediminis]|uniref:DUF2937 family protein n=1 Tax=Catenovulum sediminis TaxID=1740262 RepID=UPI001180E236|nr:DUF2937 family protein [Catenovulum sediminis]
MKFYIRAVLFSFALLVGIQIPAFIQQYKLVSTARLAEAELNLAGFQQSAEEFFGGSLEKLIVYYQQNEDVVLNANGRNINQIYLRVEQLKQEQKIFEQASPIVFIHIVLDGRQEILQQTRQEYSYMVPLNPQAVVWAISTACIFGLLFESLCFILFFCIRKLFFKRRQSV